MIKQNPKLLMEQKTILKHACCRPIGLNCLMLAVALVFASYRSFAQNQPNADSTKTKKQSNPSSDTTLKYGYAKITILGHTRTVRLPALQDSDGDGVPDQLDIEPNTTRGAEVDTRPRHRHR